MTYLIIGASDGLGAEIAKMLTNDGQVVGLSRTESANGGGATHSFGLDRRAVN